MEVYKLKYSEIANDMLSHIYEWGKEDFGAAAARHFVSLLTRDVKIL